MEKIDPSRSVDPGTARIGLFLGGLLLALVAGFGLGRVTVPQTATGAAPPGISVADHTHPPGTGPHDHDGAGTNATAPAGAGVGVGVGVGGLSLSVSGYTLVPLLVPPADGPAGTRGEFRFQVHTVDRTPVTTFAVVHEKPMHLIVVRRDLSGFQHLHPTMAPDGTWSVPLTLPEPGIWRAYTDFTALDGAGRQIAVTLGIDLVIAGDYRPRELPVDTRMATVDGFEVSYEGNPRVAATQPLLFRVSRGGVPAGLEPYLGAYGHLVALREGDLGYVHVHPEDALVNGAVKFWLAVPGPGRYRLFLDFRVAGTVHTAEFTMTVR